MGGTRLPGEAELLQAIPALNGIDPGEPTKMPLEARMYGIFAGFVLAWAWALGLKRSRAMLMPPPWMLTTFLAFVVVMGFDGINATLYDLNLMGLPAPFLYAPRLELRLATGLLCGIGIGGILLPMVNYTLWRQGRAQPIFGNARELLLLLATSAILYLLVASGSGLFLYPTSLIGVLGVILLIAGLNVVLLLSVIQRQAPVTRWIETLNPLALAVLMTAVQLGALSALRYAVFGTAVLP